MLDNITTIPIDIMFKYDKIRESQRKANKKYRESHPEKFREYSKKYYKENSEKQKEAMKKYYLRKKNEKKEKNENENIKEGF